MERTTIDPATGKSMVPVSGEVIPPGSLADLIVRVNHEHKQVKECIIKGAHHAVKAGSLHREIKEGGAEAMMWDLLRMDLDGWHPREIPVSLLKGAALQRQQAYTLPPLEQWYFGMLKDGRVPGALINNNPLSKRISRPNTAYTKSLTADARERFPRLRWELSDSMLEDFVTDEGWLKAKKFRDSKRNGWTFEPLTEGRKAWDQRYGPQQWNDAKDWDEGKVG